MTSNIAESLKTLKSFVLPVTSCSTGAVIGNLFGRSVTQISPMHALGFGLVFGAVENCTYILLQKAGVKGFWMKSGISAGVGGAAAYGASAAAAALGFAAAPITVPGAIVLTISSLILGFIFQEVYLTGKEFCCPPKCA